jgi:hypothetical protein
MRAGLLATQPGRNGRPRLTTPVVPLSPGKPMTERQWELYRLSVVEQMPESAYKKAVIDAIQHRLKMLEMQESVTGTVKSGARSAGPLRAIE